MSEPKWNAFRMWKLVIKEPHAWAEVEISNHYPGLFGVWVTTHRRDGRGQLREQYGDAGTLREAKRLGLATADELLKHAAQALGVAP